MDALYNLMVRLGVDVGGLSAAAGLAMRAFSQMEAGATRVDRLMAGTRLTLDTRGLTAGANDAMAAFRQLELQGGRMGSLFQGMNLSRGTQPLIDSVTQAQTRLAGFEQQAAAAEARVSSLDRTMARATFLNGGVPPTSRSYQWTGMERMAAGQAVLGYQGQAGTAAADLAAAQGALSSHLGTQMAGVEAAMAAEQARMNRGMGMVAGGAVLTAGGAGIVGFLSDAAKRAMELGSVMVGVQVATDGTADQMQRFSQLQAVVGTHNQMTSTQVAQLQAAALGAGLTAGARAPGQRAQMLTQLTQPLANFAEVLKMRQGMNPDESAKVAVEFAHQFGAYDTASLTQMTNLLGRALYVTPSTPQQMLTLTSQFAGVLRPLYGNTPQGQQRFMSDTIQTAALESILGQQTRGGTQIASMISRTLGGGAARVSKQSMAALEQLQQLGGGSFFTQQGAFGGMANAMEILGRAAGAKGQTPQQLERLFMLGFQRAGGLQAGILSEPSTLLAFQGLGRQLDPKTGLPSMEAIQQAYNATPAGQFAQAQANWQTFETTLGTQLLPEATMLASTLATATKNLVLFTSQHPALTKVAVTFTAIAGAASLVAGPLLMLAGAARLLGVGLGAGTLGAGGGAGGIGGLAEALAAVAGPAALVGGSLAAVIGVLHWTGGLAASVELFKMMGEAFADMGVQLSGSGLGRLIGDLFSGLGARAQETIAQLQALTALLRSQTPTMSVVPSVPGVKVLPGADPRIPGSTVHVPVPRAGGIGSTTTLPGAGTLGLLPAYPTPLGHIPQVTHLTMPPPAVARGAGGAHVTLTPGAVQVHVTTGQVKDQKKLARDIGAMVTSSIGGAIQRQTQHGAIGGSPLVPRASW